jgi:anaerobic magnesium-protoporphyrin IX monomethyl ester cyclase
MLYLINYDNGSRIPVMPQNLYHLKKCVSDSIGVKTEIIDFNLTKEPYDILHGITFQPCDIVGLGFISGYWPHREAQRIARVINAHAQRKRIEFILGGHGPSAAPEYYLNLLGADAVFVGSADISLPEWMATVRPPRIVESQGYRMDVSQVHETPDMAVYKRVRFPTTKDHEFAIQILSGRGCPYRCAFCYRMGEKYDNFPLDELIKDIHALFWFEGITHFQFSDELLMTSAAAMERFMFELSTLQKRCDHKLRFDCNGRLNVAAKHPETLAAMREVGFRYVNYGCESMSQEVLDNINKHQTVDEIRKGVANTLAASLSPGLNFMWGNPGDNYKTLWDAVEFIQKNTDFSELRTIRPVTPYPGTELFKKLNITVNEFYQEHVNSDLFSFHFMDMSNQNANFALFQANEQIIRNYYKSKVEENLSSVRYFYYGNMPPEDFRGFREV